jgi:hypothetical protein
MKKMKRHTQLMFWFFLSPFRRFPGSPLRFQGYIRFGLMGFQSTINNNKPGPGAVNIIR